MRINKSGDLQNLGEFLFRFARLEAFVAELTAAPDGFVREKQWADFFQNRLPPTMTFDLSAYPEMSKDLYRTVLVNGQWNNVLAVSGATQIDFLKKLVRIRHNLFHGGKDFSQKRDMDLVLEGLEVLKKMESDLPDYYKYL